MEMRRMVVVRCLGKARGRKEKVSKGYSMLDRSKIASESYAGKKVER
jgi:hypothetical protein